MGKIIDIVKHLAAERDKEPLGNLRSPEWPKVRAEHLKNNPTCACCGGTENLQVHHIKEFHNYPELELEPTNLITLCEGNKYLNCHLTYGHLGWYSINNPNVLDDAINVNKMFSVKAELVEKEKARLKNVQQPELVEKIEPPIEIKYN